MQAKGSSGKHRSGRKALHVEAPSTEARPSLSSRRVTLQISGVRESYRGGTCPPLAIAGTVPTAVRPSYMGIHARRIGRGLTESLLLWDYGEGIQPLDAKSEIMQLQIRSEEHT